MNNRHKSREKKPDLNQIKIEVQTAFEKYIEAYFTLRDADKTFAMFGEEMTVIGSGPDEIAFDMGQVKTLYLRDLSQAPTTVEVNCHRLNVEVLSASTGLVTALVSIKTKIGDNLIEADGLRISAIFRQIGNDWFIIHKHISLPTNDYEKGESYPIEELKKRNQWLEEKINEKTQALEATNKKLQLDIAKRRETEIRLQISEVQKNAILNGITSNIAFVDKDLKIIWANKTAAESIKTTPDEMIGHTCYHFWADPSEPCKNCPSLKALETKKSEQTIMHTPDGRVWEERGEPVFDDKGNIIGVVEIATDITERARIEDALRESEEKHRVLFESAGDAIFIHDSKSPRMLAVNLQACKQLGYTNAELMAMPTGAVDTQEQSKYVPERVARLMEQGHITFETVHQHKDGSHIPTEVSARCIIWDGQPVIMSICRDITDRKQAEAALQEREENLSVTLHSIGDGVISTDINGLIVNMNPIAEKLCGWDFADAAGNPLTEVFNIINSETKETVADPVKKVLQSGEIVGLANHTVLISKNGNEYQIADSAAPIKNKNGEISGVVLVFSDVTEKYVVQNQIKESEERYHSLLVNLEAGIVVHAPDTSIIMNNPRASELLGLSDNQLRGKTAIDPAWKFVDEDNIPLPIEEYPVNRILTGKKPINQILGIQQPGTNDITWVSVNGFQALNNTGGISEIVISFLDITERKQAEKLLREREDRFTLAINGTGAGVWDWDMVKNEVVFSIQWKKMLGYEDNEVENSFMGWKNLWHPDDVVPIEKAIDDYIAGKTNHYEIIHRCRNKNGDWQWILTRGDIVKDVQGKSCRWVGTNIDITKRKKAEESLRESEEKLSALFGSMTEMVVLHEVLFNDHGEAINYRITDCNHAYTQITGIKKEDAVGKLATEVYHTDSAPYLAEYSLVAMTGEPYEFTSYFAPMDKHFMISVVSPMKNHFATITTDITAIKQIQEIISDKNKELENYLYAASHDLRSPLVNIHGFSQRLQTQTDSIKTILSGCRLESEQMAEIDKIANEGIPKTLNFIFSNVTKMDTLLNGLLQISRTGRIKMTICKVDMNQLFKTIIASFNFQITEISAKVIIGDLPYCWGDENQLNQLFSNIIGNALKYREKTRQLVVEISGRTQYNKVTYSIKDTGIGIALRHLEKIWDVFYKVDVEGSEAGEGIGLSLAKRITEKHRGKAWAESEEGKGTTFHIELQKNEFSE